MDSRKEGAGMDGGGEAVGGGGRYDRRVWGGGGKAGGNSWCTKECYRSSGTARLELGLVYMIKPSTYTTLSRA